MRVAALVGIATATVALVGLLALALDQPVAFLTRDPPAAVRDGACSTECFYAGLLSNLGVLVYAGGASVCLFVLFVLPADRSPQRRTIAWGAVLLVVLLTDDMFGLHDHLAPSYVPRGEQVVQVAIGAAALLYVIGFRQRLVDSGLAALVVVAGAMYAVSTGSDAARLGGHLLEDGSKFVGIVSLSALLIALAVQELKQELEVALEGKTM